MAIPQVIYVFFQSAAAPGRVTFISYSVASGVQSLSIELSVLTSNTDEDNPEPVATYVNGKLYLLGRGGDRAVWLTTYDGDTWADATVLQGCESQTPPEFYRTGDMGGADIAFLTTLSPETISYCYFSYPDGGQPARTSYPFETTRMGSIILGGSTRVFYTSDNKIYHFDMLNIFRNTNPKDTGCDGGANRPSPIFTGNQLYVFHATSQQTLKCMRQNPDGSYSDYDVSDISPNNSPSAVAINDTTALVFYKEVDYLGLLVATVDLSSVDRDGFFRTISIQDLGINLAENGSPFALPVGDFGNTTA